MITKLEGLVTKDGAREIKETGMEERLKHHKPGCAVRECGMTEGHLRTLEEISIQGLTTGGR